MADRRKKTAARAFAGFLALGYLFFLCACQQPVSNHKSLHFDSVEKALHFGNAVSEQASAESERDLLKARELWRKAKLGYRAALEMSPNDANVLFSYAVTLSDEAEVLALTDYAEAQALWNEAKGYYDRCLKANPREDRAANSWGLALAAEAKSIAQIDLSSARVLWQMAGEKYAQALDIQPDKHGAANNWGNALAAEAEAVASTELPVARTLWAGARVKYLWALQIKPDKYNAMSNFGAASANEAEALAKAGQWSAADRLWAESIARYEAALMLNPLFQDALYGYGITLDKQAQLIAPMDIQRASEVWVRACEFYARALEQNDAHFPAALNWALALQRKIKASAPMLAAEALPAWDEAIRRSRKALQINPRSNDAYTGLGNSLDGKARVLAAAGNLNAARPLWREAESAYAESLKFKPSTLAAVNWGRLLQAEAAHTKITDPGESLAALRKARAMLLNTLVFFPSDEELAWLIGISYLDEYEAVSGRSTNLAEKSSLLQQAQRQFAAIVHWQDSARAWESWGTALLSEGGMHRLRDPDLSRRLLVDAAEKYQEALRLQPSNYTTCFNLAVVYEHIAYGYYWKDRDVALGYFQRAEAQSAQAGSLKADAIEPRLLFANVLCAQALIQSRRNSITTLELCRRADEAFSQLAERGPITGSQAASWARALAQEAEAISVIALPLALRTFEAAAEKFAEAHRLSADPGLLISWGQLLQAKAQAQCLSDLPAARQAWAEAREKYTAKARLDAHAIDAPIEISLTLLREYAALPAGDRPANIVLLDEAEKALRAVEAIVPGAGAYNLACIFAWRNSPKEAVAWLEHARKSGRLPNREIVMTDGYIRLVAQSEEFNQWLKAAYSRQ